LVALKVPIKSISITVLNPFGVIFSKDDKKLPAAPFIKISILPPTLSKKIIYCFF